jgi:xanthosine utilization system XapX-like protein
MVANAVGILVGYFICTGVSSKIYLSDPSYITWSVMGVLVGGILGWFVGNKKQPIADEVMQTGSA